ncbi:MAG: hypothetical protein ABI346_02395 [Candidatus Baltobacteraceae bacterium]
MAATVSAVAATGCTSGNSAIAPAFQSVDISKIGKLQFAVGTANIAPSGSSGSPFVGLNTVVTFRQANGGSAFAVDEPQIVGPPGFTVPSTTDAGTDGGTNTINSTPQSPSGGGPATTFGTSGQAQLYGFGPGNYGISGGTSFGVYALPFYAANLPSGGGGQLPFAGGAPAFSLPSTGGFPGFNEGFTDFAATAVSGTYTMNVTIPTSPGSSQKAYTYTQAAPLDASKILPAFQAPQVTPNADGSVAITLQLPSGASEAYGEIFVPQGSGGTNLTLSYKAGQSATQVLPASLIGTCTSFLVVAVGFDYPAQEAIGAVNRSQSPPILGPNGQDDITVSPVVSGQSAGPSSNPSCK